MVFRVALDLVNHVALLAQTDPVVVDADHLSSAASAFRGRTPCARLSLDVPDSVLPDSVLDFVQSPSSVMLSSAPQALQCTASVSWRLRPQAEQR